MATLAWGINTKNNHANSMFIRFHFNSSLNPCSSKCSSILGWIVPIRTLKRNPFPESKNLRFLAFRSQFASLTESIVGSLGCRATKSFRVSVRSLVGWFSVEWAVLTKTRDVSKGFESYKDVSVFLCMFLFNHFFKICSFEMGAHLFGASLKMTDFWGHLHSVLGCLLSFWHFFSYSGQLNINIRRQNELSFCLVSFLEMVLQVF